MSITKEPYPYDPLALMARFQCEDDTPDWLNADELHFLVCWLIDERARLQLPAASTQRDNCVHCNGWLGTNGQCREQCEKSQMVVKDE